jgi:hypothetical protein
MGYKVYLGHNLVVGVDGRVHKMKFKVCTKIEMHNKFLVSKLNFLSKHVDQRTTITIIPNVVTMEEYYFLKKNKHVFNDLYVSRGKNYVVQHVGAKVVVKNICSFCIHFSIFKKR